ncbi:hypothetical protein V5G24_15160 [Xanthobacter sp. VTT E-85241]|uniref:hypothetical protein n=1 Tax=Roseixanthobacter finlandensis TaxID=3119922 RepID=UPI00372AC9C3
MSSWDHGSNDDFNWDLDVTYEFSSDVSLEFDTTTEYSSDFNVDPSIEVCVDIDGNFAGFNVDVQAVGDDTSVEVNLAVVTTDDYSSIPLSGYSAVA